MNVIVEYEHRKDVYVPCFVNKIKVFITKFTVLGSDRTLRT